MLLGVRDATGCGCEQGTIDVSTSASTPADCQSCSDGLFCPDMSTKDTLQSGTSPHGDRYVPKLLLGCWVVISDSFLFHLFWILLVKSYLTCMFRDSSKGYYSTVSDPLSVFKCGSEKQCPGGVPGTCGGGREGIPCGECPAESFWVNHQCSGCSGWAIVGWILTLVIMFGGLVAAYYLLNAGVTAKASTLFSTTCAIGMMINMLQNLGIIGTMTVEFPVNLEGIFSFLQIFTFDIDGLGFACLTGRGPRIPKTSWSCEIL